MICEGFVLFCGLANAMFIIQESVVVMISLSLSLSLFVIVTFLPWPHRQMYSCIRQKGGRTSSKSPRRRVAKIPEFQKDNYYNVQSKMRGQ